MNYQAILALLGDLYNQVAGLQQQNADLRAQVAALQKAPEVVPAPAKASEPNDG